MYLQSLSGYSSAINTDIKPGQKKEKNIEMNIIITMQVNIAGEKMSIFVIICLIRVKVGLCALIEGHSPLGSVPTVCKSVSFFRNSGGRA